jgi:hypothetical protein
MKNPLGSVLKVVVLLGAVLAWRPAGVEAQSVSGRLLDAESGRPIPTAAIALLRGDTVVASTTSNLEGVFVLNAPRPGSYRIRAEHIAYQPSTGESMAIGENERLILDLRMSVAAIALEAVTVVAAPERRRGELGGFYDRQQRSPAGTFLTRADIEKTRASTTSQVLQYGGLQVTYDRYGDPSFSSGLRAPCMDIIIDGVRNRTSMVVNVDQVVPPEFIEGIEIYKDPQTIPPPHGAAWSSCGAILIWTEYSR